MCICNALQWLQWYILCGHNKILELCGMQNGISMATMMTSSNGNIFRVTGPLCGEFTGPGEFPTQRPVTWSFDVSLIRVWINGWVNNRDAGDLRRHLGHYDVSVMRDRQSLYNAYIAHVTFVAVSVFHFHSTLWSVPLIAFPSCFLSSDVHHKVFRWEHNTKQVP